MMMGGQQPGWWAGQTHETSGPRAETPLLPQPPPPQFKTVNPVGDRVFIKVDTSDEVTIGGIVLPASAQKKPTQGKVVSAPKGKGVAVRTMGDYVWACCTSPVGDLGATNSHGLSSAATSILTHMYAHQVGDTVVYSKYAGTELTVGDDSFVLLKEDDCIGKMPLEDVAKMLPLGDRVLIEVQEAEDQTVGGVLLTESAKDKPTLGKVSGDVLRS